MFRPLVLDGVYFTTHSSQYNYKHQKLLKRNSSLRIIIIHGKQYGKINEGRLSEDWESTLYKCDPNFFFNSVIL